MRWFIKLFFVLAVLSGAALGQAFTQVTGVAKDAQNNIYQNCVFSIHFVGQSNQPGPYLLQGSVFQLTYAGVRCDGFGNFAIRLPSNQAIFPQPSVWEFNICDSSGHFCNATGTGQVTIAGNSQDISAQMTPILPILPPPGAAVTSVFGRSGQVVAQTGDYTFSQVTGAAPLASPTFSGLPQVPTATVGTFNNQAASTAFVMTAVGNAIGGGGVGGGASNSLLFGTTTIPLGTPAPTSGQFLMFNGTSIIGGTPSGGGAGAVSSVFGRTGTVVAGAGDYNVGQITGAAPQNNPIFTGSPQGPTPATGDNSTLLATTAWVRAQGYTTGSAGGGLSGCQTLTTGNLICDNSIQGGTGTVGLLTMPYSAGSPPTPPAGQQAAIAPDASGNLMWSPGNSTPFAAIGTGPGGGTPTTGVTTFAGRQGDITPQVSDYSAFFAPIGAVGGAMGGVTVIE